MAIIKGSLQRLDKSLRQTLPSTTSSTDCSNVYLQVVVSYYKCIRCINKMTPKCIKTFCKSLPVDVAYLM